MKKTASSIETVTVTITIKTFNPAPTPCIVKKPTLSAGAKRIKYKSADPANHTIIALGDPASPLDIVFSVPGYTLGPASTPMSFAGANGAANFPTQAVNGSSVTVTDAFANTGTGADNPSWKYSIAVISPDGVQGIIDPTIENEANPP